MKKTHKRNFILKTQGFQVLALVECGRATEYGLERQGMFACFRDLGNPSFLGNGIVRADKT